MKGNVVDLAVAVVIGAAFGAVVNSFVANILMPLISALVGAPNFGSFGRVVVNGNAILFGSFLTVLVNFILVAAAIYFVVVMPMNHIIARRNAKLGITDEAAADPQIELLTEIRDALQSK
jgi:large conductance mechanosensitive channel